MSEDIESLVVTLESLGSDSRRILPYSRNIETGAIELEIEAGERMEFLMKLQEAVRVKIMKEFRWDEQMANESGVSVGGIMEILPPEAPPTNAFIKDRFHAKTLSQQILTFKNVN